MEKEKTKKELLEEGKEFLENRLKEFDRLLECSSCGTLIGVSSHVSYGKNFCPSCVNKVLGKKKQEWEKTIAVFEKAVKQEEGGKK